jgi:hypothetical protein
LVYSVKKTPSIDIIFEKNESSNLTLNSLLRQDILAYYLEVIIPKSKTTFTFYELIEWIIDYNDEISNDYKDLSTRNIPKRNRISDRWDRVKNKFQELKSLELIKEKGTEKTSKGGTTSTYQFTDIGALVALVIQLEAMENEDAKNKTIELIYHLICCSLSTHQSISNKYFLSVFRQLWENKLFVSYLVAFARSIGIEQPLFTKNIQFQIPTDKAYQTIKRNALNQLDENQKKLFLYSFKIVMESSFLKNSQNPKGFEDVSFRARGSAEQLAVEGYCEKCNLYVPLIIRTIDYFNIPGHHNSTVQTCPKCKIPESMSIHVYREGLLLPADFL